MPIRFRAGFSLLGLVELGALQEELREHDRDDGPDHRENPEDEPHGLRSIPEGHFAVHDALTQDGRPLGELRDPTLQHVTGEHTDHRLRAEPGDHGDAQVGALLPLGRDCRDVLLESRGPEHLSDGEHDHAEHGHGVVRRHEATREDLPRDDEREQAGPGHDRTPGEGLVHVHLAGDGDEQDEPQHDESRVDRLQETHCRIRTDDALPVLGHEGVEVDEHRPGSHEQGHQEHQLPEHPLGHYVPEDHPGLGLLGLHPFLSLLPFHVVVGVDHEENSEQAEHRQDHGEQDDVGLGEPQAHGHHVHDHAGQEAAEVHEQVPDIEGCALRLFSGELAVADLVDRLVESELDTHPGEQEHDHDLATIELLAGKGDPSHEPHADDLDDRTDVQGLADTQPVRDGPHREEGDAGHDPQHGVGIPRAGIAEPAHPAQEGRDHDHEAEVGRVLQEVDRLDAPEPLRALFQHTECREVLDDGVAPRLAFSLFHWIGSSEPVDVDTRTQNYNYPLILSLPAGPLLDLRNFPPFKVNQTPHHGATQIEKTK